ncbi:MAG TPA: Spy/CpxP family protein refolding chaperone [Bryobacteraceae bacterium]|nr:Spy/CpxP family protein refolding chaperone [Bryobacteraceae bacterium]
MHKKAIPVLATLAAATCLVAQTGPAPEARTPPTPEEIAARRVQHLTRLLDLTTAQQESAATIFTEEARAMLAARPAVRTAHQAMRDAVRNTGLDSDIERAAAQIGNAHTQIATIEGKAQARFRALLTAEQKAKLDSARSRGMHGPGPMRGRGPMSRRFGR